MGLIDTNSDPDVVEFGVPANDDAIRSISLMTSIMADAVLAGAGQAEVTAAEMAGEPAAEAEKAAEPAEAPEAEKPRAMTLQEVVLAQPAQN